MSTRVWVTRTQPDADATAARVRALGFEPIVQPVLEARAVASTIFDLESVEALAFTSGHAVRAFAVLADRRDLAVFAVGDRTAQAARDVGFTEVRSAAGDAVALAERIAEVGVRRVLHPRGAETAAELSALLATRGVEARAVVVYETAPTPLEAAPDVPIVLIHSPKAGRRVAAIVDSGAAAAMTALCLSPVAAKALQGRGFERVASALFPNEASLLDLLKEP